MNLQKLQSRKLIFAMTLFILSTTFIFTGHATFDSWSEFMKWIFGAYVVGNAGSKIASKT